MSLTKFKKSWEKNIINVVIIENWNPCSLPNIKCFINIKYDFKKYFISVYSIIKTLMKHKLTMCLAS